MLIAVTTTAFLLGACGSGNGSTAGVYVNVDRGDFEYGKTIDLRRDGVMVYDGHRLDWRVEDDELIYRHATLGEFVAQLETMNGTRILIDPDGIRWARTACSPEDTSCLEAFLDDWGGNSPG